MAWTNVHAGASTHVGSNTTISLTVTSTTAGNLVVACLGVGFTGPGTGTGGSYFTTTPSGFLVAKINTPAQANQQEIWYNPNIGSGVTTLTFSSTGSAHALDGQAAEFNFSGLVAPTINISDTGAGNSTSSGTSQSCTYGGTSASGDLIIFSVDMSMSTGTTTYTDPSGFATWSNSGGTSAAFHSAASYLLNGNAPVTINSTTGATQTAYATAGAAFQSPTQAAQQHVILQAVKRANYY